MRLSIWLLLVSLSIVACTQAVEEQRTTAAETADVSPTSAQPTTSSEDAAPETTTSTETSASTAAASTAERTALQIAGGAAIPALCDHPASTLVNGEDPNVPDGDGYFQLLDAHAVERDGVTRIAAIAECNAGGVGWPNQLLVFDTAGQFLSTSDLWDYDWEALGFWGPSRNGVTAVSTDSGMLRLDLLMYNPEDPLCCATGTAMVTVDVFGDTPRISAIEAHSNQIAEPAPSSESAGNDVALCADHGEAVMAGATENFDVAICFADQSRNSAVYVGKKRETGDSIVLPVCRHTTDWQAENSGYEYWIAYDLISGVGFLQVDDPSGETIVLETINVAFDNEASAAHLAGSDC